MIEFLQYKFVQRAIIASLLTGAGCGIVGVWVFLMRIPFVGVLMSHSAFAGAILGLIFHINPLILSLLFCLLSSALIGPISDKADIEPELSLSVIFSIMLGIAFAGMGFLKDQMERGFRFLWGSILTLSSRDLYLLSILLFITISVLLFFYREIQCILFSRKLAKISGVPEKALFYFILFLIGAEITFSLNTVGGLLIFSLIIGPPASAYQLTYDLKKMYFLSAIFGAWVTIFGLFTSIFLPISPGALIVLGSGFLLGTTILISPKRRFSQ